ncbi:hypothetical protein FLK61_30955 [Paenalkalicoccus suaedae]|uniref:DUF3888 domain-containing protein n=1 Tax=Paenalkalicoccus suaedae TaxID=2592382 RepID=A0A859FDI3_9BACI|nr:hypothetical protein [Paenalkalicoccus suaedae]QKS71137.1 hypothetical protein FLK61_30955 [Paenalkalicoccus suaedae]
MKWLMNGMIILSFSFLVACSDDTEWSEVTNEEDVLPYLTLVENYLDTWERALETQSFSIMEPLMVPNSHGYHIERRQHQELIGSRIIDRAVDTEDPILEENQYDSEKRLRITVWIDRESPAGVEQIERTRYYYMNEGNQGLRVTAIETVEEDM